MAILKLRTDLSTIVILVLVNAVKSDNELRPQVKSNYMANIPAQHLLRGSSEDIQDVAPKDLDNPILVPRLSINTDKHEQALKLEDLNEEITTLDYNNLRNLENAVPDVTQDLRFTTADPMTEMPEVLATTWNDNNDTKFQIVHRKEGKNVLLMEGNPQTIDDMTTARNEMLTETSTTVDLNNLPTTDTYDHIFRFRSGLDDLPDENYFHSNDNKVTGSTSHLQEKIEPTTTEVMKQAEDSAASPRMSDLFDDIETIGQKNIKTEPLESKRNNIEKALKATKSYVLKSWLEDSWLRQPAGILVPLRPMALSRALAVWNDLIENEGLNVTDIIIIGYDSNGINWRSRHNLHSGGNKDVSDSLSKLLLKYQGVRSNEASGDGTMKALASSSKLVPYDSALFLITDKGASDSKKLPLALRALVEKRLKVYTIWTDPNYQTKESDVSLENLRKISQLTEGDVLKYSLQVTNMDIETSFKDLQQSDMKLPPRISRLNSQFSDKFETLLVRRGGGDAGSHGIPVENGVTALRVYIEGAVEHAVLYPPNGPQIDLFNESSVKAFSPNSRTESQTPRNVYISFPGTVPENILSVLPAQKNNIPEQMAPTVGLWHLSVHCDTCDYRLTVSAHAKIGFDAALSKRNDGKEIIHLRVMGPVATVRESTIVDEYGAEVGKLPFSYEPPAGEAPKPGNINEETSQPELMADVPMPTVAGNKNKIYVKVTGRDVQGNSFVRLSGPLRHRQELRKSRSAHIVFPDYQNKLELVETNQKISNVGIVPYPYNDTIIASNSRASSQATNQRGSILTAVQIGLSTRLYGAPGDNLQLHFEVTNFRDQIVRFRFEAVGELRFLRGISPSQDVIQPGQTANVIVNVGITTSAQPGARDLITFTAYGFEQVSISAYVYVVNPDTPVTDVWAPILRHTFQGSCIGRTGEDCAQHAWSATVIARDSLGGLLRLTSSPIGLVYDTNFVSGTREEVMATYRATCCAPRMMITAIDTFGNANSYVVDISSYFTEAAIAAIVLGVFVLIALIALIAFLIYWCVRRRKESRELPYSTTSRTSRRADIG